MLKMTDHKYNYLQKLLLLSSFVWVCNADCEGYEENPMIVVSLDGFLSSYVDRGFSPTLRSLIDEGVTTKYMHPSFPTSTFPNHLSIATGLYTESHGIIANSFYDSELDDWFSSSDLSDGKWFSGEPIWNTVVKNNKKSATYFWPGCEAEINGMRPTYGYNITYDHDVPFDERIDQVLEWLTMPEEDRPVWISVYFHEPDSAGHEFGPFSSEVNDTIVNMDILVKSLIDGIADLNLTDCVNLIFVSDHGMAEGGSDRRVFLENYDAALEDKGNIFEGSFSRIDLYPEYQDEQVDIMESIACQKPYLRQFDTKSFPKRLHYSNSIRMEDVILDMDPGYSSTFQETWTTQGNHGFDNEYEAMQALFIAYGPAFKKGITIRPFHNIELYNLMCDILSLDVRAPTNGTIGSLSHALVTPPSYPDLPMGEYPGDLQFPDDVQLLENLDSSLCPGDLLDIEDWMYGLDFANETKQSLLNFHIPFGVPYPSQDFLNPVKFLYHSDHVTGYSESLKIPLWTSYTINALPVGSNQSNWNSDFRLSEQTAPSCSSAQYSFSPLFRNEYSIDDTAVHPPFFTTNAVSLSDHLQSRYNELMNSLIPQWLSASNGLLNIMAGPLFDNNYDSLLDTYEEIVLYNGVPSDLFVIVTRCITLVPELTSCQVDDMEVMAFIYGQNQTVSNCLNELQFAGEFNARVKDVEIGTSLVFFSSLGYQNSTDVSLRYDLELWDLNKYS